MQPEKPLCLGRARWMLLDPEFGSPPDNKQVIKLIQTSNITKRVPGPLISMSYIQGAPVVDQLNYVRLI